MKTSQLEVGDVWAVSLPSGRFGCMQVADLRRNGVGARSSFVAGPLAWVGDDVPTLDPVEGRPLLEIGLLRLDVFAAWKAQIFGTCEVNFPSGYDSPFAPPRVGSRTRVYGHLAVPNMVQSALDSAL